MKKNRVSPYYVPPKKWWQRSAPAVIALISFALIAGLYVARDGSTTNDLNLGDVGGEGVLHRVYLDGWSYRTLDGTSIYAGTDEKPLTLTFSPLDVEGLRDAVKRDPEIVQNTFARLVTADSSLRCVSSGCTTDGGTVDMNLLADLSSVPGLGSSYKAWSVKYGLYIAEFRAPEGALISIGAEAWDDLVIQESPTIDEDATFVVGEFGTKVPTVDLPAAIGSVYGYGRRSWDVAAAWGRFFIPDARWDDDKPTVSLRGSGSTTPVLADIAKTFGGSFLAHGLADRADLPSINGFDSSQLTYFSSPVTGCGVAALCAPISLDVKVRNIARETAKVCNGNRYAVAVAYTNEWEATLIGQIHVFGAWNGKDPATFTDTGYPSVVGYSGSPELVGGLLSTRQANVALIGATGEVFAVAGSRGQIGVDGPEYVNATSHLSELDKYFNGDWKRC